MNKNLLLGSAIVAAVGMLICVAHLMPIWGHWLWGVVIVLLGANVFSLTRDYIKNKKELDMPFVLAIYFFFCLHIFALKTRDIVPNEKIIGIVFVGELVLFVVAMSVFLFLVCKQFLQLGKKKKGDL